MSRLVRYFSRNNGMLYNENNFCVLKTNVRDILSIAHENSILDHLGYTKTFSRPSGYHWKNKSLDVFDYRKRCLVCQSNKDSRTKPLEIPKPLEFPDRR